MKGLMLMKNANETVTMKISNEYKNWGINENIILDMPMGRGKTHFIINVLGEYAEQEGEQILYLCNRSKLKEDVFDELEEVWATNVIVKTYQSIQNTVSKDKEIPEYKYIVCDECHYLLSDSWNDKTDIMYKWLKNDKTSCKIFMSATGHNIFPLIKKWGEFKEYKLNADYSYIEKVVFYDEDEYIYNIIEELDANEKLIYFSRKVDNAYKVYDRCNKHNINASFVCSQYTKHKEYIEYINTDALVEEKLQSQVTCTTSVWDNGINIKDEQLKHIVCDMEDLVTLIQAIGRKRVGKITEDGFVLGKNDNVTIHIKQWSKENLNRFANSKRAILNEVDKYLYRDNEWLQEQKEKRSKRINCCLYLKYDDVQDKLIVELNPLRYEGTKRELKRLKYAINNGFDKQVLGALGNSFVGKVEYISIKQIEKKTDIEEFMEYLNGKIATRLFKEDQQELKDVFDKVGLKVKSDRNMGMKTMNAFMEENNIPFRIESSRVKVDGKRYTIWTILQ